LRVALAYLALLAAITVFGIDQNLSSAWGPALAYAFFAYAWILVIASGILPEYIRKPAGLLLDHIIFATGFYVGGPGFALVFWAPIFATIGYGLRFGTNYAYASGAAGAVLIPLAMYHSPFWSQNFYISAGVVLASCMLPAYSFRLALNIARSKEEMEARALQLETASKTDHLTGLLNRKGFSESVTSLLERESISAVLYLDLDGFKAVNDSCGHAVGDRVLQEVADCLRKCLRNTDHVARLGGDEFGVCVSNLLEEGDAHRLAGKILDSIGSIRIPELGASSALGASIGVCLLPHIDAKCVASVTRIADGLMYQAKRSGKNCYASSVDQ
jgi:diguanylate cyclase (GGDEF)-like protein